jgi:hexulose-6-phosphate isomerase
VKTSISIAAYQETTAVEQLLDQAARAGFQGVELGIGVDGPLTYATPEADCRQLALAARQAGLTVSGLVAQGFREITFTSPDLETRQTARRRTVAALERARWLGAEAVTLVPGMVGDRDSRQPAAAYEEAYTLALEALSSLRFPAERFAIRIACENDWNRFLLSPLEFRAFIDEINSPWVGICLDIGRVMPFGYPQDWMVTLGHRVFRVCCTDYGDGGLTRGNLVPPGRGCVDWPAVLDAFRRVNYNGPLTYEGSGGFAEIAAWFTALLAGGQSPAAQ